MAQRGPALRDGVSMVTQHFRGEESFVLKDPSTQKYFRFRPAEAAVIRAFDGSRTVEEIAAGLARTGLAISAGAVASFARTLSGLGLVEQSLSERTALQMERLRRERRQRRSLFRGEALRMRWSFGDSDPWFERWIGALRWCFTPWFVVVSVVLFVVYTGIIVSRWDQFGAAVAATFAPSQLDVGRVVILIVVFAALTLIHEVAHGFACKGFGGEVHELGFMMLYFMPAFYCNVNDAWSFPDKRSRLWVTAAGGWVELLVTSIGTIVWAVVRPEGLIGEVTLAMILLGGFSAVLTNANPLLPLDGYFALADYLELPNLRHRAAAHLVWWLKRNLLRMDLPDPGIAPRERRILLTYAACAALYTGIFLTSIALLALRGSYRAIGFLGGALVVLGVLALARRKLVTLWRAIILSVRARTDGDQWRRWRRRTPLVAAAALVVAALIPWNLETGGRFAVTPVRMLAVTAADSGVVVDVYPQEGERVATGSPLVRILDLDRTRAVTMQTLVVDSFDLEGRSARARGLAGSDAQLTAAGRSAAARLAATEARLDQQTIRARFAGTVVSPHPELQVGRRVEPGDTVLLIYDLDRLEVRGELGRAGGAAVVPGLRVRILPFQDFAGSFDGQVGSVAPVGVNGTLQVRIPLPRETRLRPGSTGEFEVVLRRSTMLGAIWWGIRSRIRNDLLL